MTRTSRSAALRPTSLHAGVFTTLFVLALAFCNAAAGDAPQPAPAPAAAPSPSVRVEATAPTLRVAIDPVSGALTMPEPESGVFAPLWSLRRVPSGPLPVVRLADGSLMVDLTDIYLTNAVASIGLDGRPVLGCSEFGVDPIGYARWLTLTAPPVRAKVKE